MRKELAIHLFCLVVFFLLLTVFKKLITPAYILFWVGGIVGTLLPDIDHLIYAYFLQPHELTSQRVQSTLQKGEISGAANLLVATQNERTNLIFHSAWFQLFFFAVTFLVVSSSSSLLAKGIVLAFSLHLLVDQFGDLSQKGTLASWFVQMRMSLSREKSLFYCLFLLLILIVIGLLM